MLSMRQSAKMLSVLLLNSFKLNFISCPPSSLAFSKNHRTPAVSSPVPPQRLQGRVFLRVPVVPVPLQARHCRLRSWTLSPLPTCVTCPQGTRHCVCRRAFSSPGFARRGAELSLKTARVKPRRLALHSSLHPQRSFPQPLFPLLAIIPYTAKTAGNILSICPPFTPTSGTPRRTGRQSGIRSRTARCGRLACSSSRQSVRRPLRGAAEIRVGELKTLATVGCAAACPTYGGARVTGRETFSVAKAPVIVMDTAATAANTFLITALVGLVIA